MMFVTGAGGFIGSHVVHALLAKGHRVRALVHYNGSGRRGFLDQIKGTEGEMIHYGQGSAVSVGALADLCLSILIMKGRAVMAGNRVRPSMREVDLLLCDASKAADKLGWAPQISLNEGIRRTAVYIREHLGFFRSGNYAQ